MKYPARIILELALPQTIAQSWRNRILKPFNKKQSWKLETPRMRVI